MNGQVEGAVSQHAYNGGLLFGPFEDPRVLADLGAVARGFSAQPGLGRA
jgi:hypothetical protein